LRGHKQKPRHYEYCELMKEFSGKVYGALNKPYIYDTLNQPYLAEMLLFRIADPEIIEDLEKSVKVTIKTDY